MAKKGYYSFQEAGLIKGWRMANRGVFDELLQAFEERGKQT